MSSGPYVAFRVNRASKSILTDSIRFEPDPHTTFTNPFEWLVVCDSDGKVVLRALEDGKTSLRVIALAELRGLTLVFQAFAYQAAGCFRATDALHARFH